MVDGILQEKKIHHCHWQYKILRAVTRYSNILYNKLLLPRVVDKRYVNDTRGYY